jgi:hypothetical protein
MTSRLASLLVQEGLVSAKKMAQAFQRQVIYGGTLDTILLEMDALDEPTLVEAMGRASGLPTAGDLPAKEWLDAAGAKEWFPHALSERFRAVPVSLDGNVLRVLVTDPPDRKQMDELGYMLSRSIDAIVVTEHRFAQAVELVYNLPVPARFASLAGKLRQRAAENRPAPKVIQMEAEEPPATSRYVVPERGEPMLTAPPSAPTMQLPAVSALHAAQPVIEKLRALVTDVPMPAPSAPRAPVDDTATPRMTTRQAGAPIAPLGQEVTVQSVGVVGTDASALSLSEAGRRIEAAPDRDAIFETLCRGARSRLQFVGLLMVHGDVAVGRLALGLQWLPREAVAQVSVSLDKPSPFRAAVAGKAPYIGRLGEEPVGEAALSALGRRPPLPALLLPIVLKERTVALLYGDADGNPIEAELLADLSTAVAAAGRSFQRLILRQKGAEYAKAPPKAAPAGKLNEGGAVKGDGAVGLWRAVTAPAGGESSPTEKMDVARMTSPGFAALSSAVVQTLQDQPTQKLEQPPGAPSLTDIESLIQSVVREDEHAQRSLEALSNLGERAAEMVVKHLPGPLRLDRHTLRGPTPPLGDHGPLLAVLARLSRSSLRPLLLRANDQSLEVRYYVTLALGELKEPSVVPVLGQRLFDNDAGVRHVAMQALAKMDPSSELRTLTESLRGELPGPERARQRFSAEALGALRDVPSVPRLIELVKHPDERIVVSARRALVDITKQDFGTSRWRWRGWWDRHRNEPRVEWMLEGLGHAEAEVRLSASEELRALSSEYFGYHFDLPKREREEARRKWVDWWRTHGTKKQQEKR